MRRLLPILTVLLLGIALFPSTTTPAAAQQLAKRLILKAGSYQPATKWGVKGGRGRYPGAGALGERLSRKDRFYQPATKWEVKGDRVRYLSAERNEWEEVPNSMVDWAAAEKYEKDRAAGETGPEAGER